MGPSRARIVVWLRAFRGFYDRADPIGSQDLVAKLLFSARSLILIISAQAAIIAGLIAYIRATFSPLYFFLVLMGFVIIHAASNLMNDYFGYLRGHDTDDAPRRRYTLHPLADGVLTKEQMKKAIMLLISSFVAIALYLTLVRGVLIPLFAIAGIMILALYDAAPRPLKSIGLGEIASFIVWGPLMIAGGYFAIGGELSLEPFLASIPYGLGVMSILMGKHIDQEEFDDRKGLRTLPVIVGEERARTITAASLLLMYAIAVGSAIYGALPATVLLVLVNYKRLISSFRTLLKPRPSQPPEGYVGWPLWYHRHCLLHNKSFGWLYIVSLFAAAFMANTLLADYAYIRLF